MRRIIATGIMMVLMLILTACQSSETVQVKYNEVTYQLVDTVTGDTSTTYYFESSSDQSLTITEDSGGYKVKDGNLDYQVKGNTVVIGDSTCTMTGTSAACSGSNDINLIFRVSEVYRLIQNNEFGAKESTSNEVSGLMIFFGFIAIVMGIIRLKVPRFTWFHRHGWKYKNVEASDTFLDVIRLSGILFIIVGVVMIVKEFL
jgi:hypothetical protein